MNPAYEQMVVAALTVAQQVVDEESIAEAVVEWGESGQAIISKNEEGGFLTVGIPLALPADEEAAAEVREQVLLLGSSTVLGHVLVGAYGPDQQLLLSALIPLALVDEAEVERRVSHLVAKIHELEQRAPQDAIDAGTGAEHDLGSAVAGGWMRI